MPLFGHLFALGGGVHVTHSMKFTTFIISHMSTIFVVNFRRIWIQSTTDFHPLPDFQLGTCGFFEVNFRAKVCYPQNNPNHYAHGIVSSYMFFYDDTTGEENQIRLNFLQHWSVRFLILSARVANWAKVMFSQASVLLSRLRGLTLNTSWDSSHGQGGVLVLGGGGLVRGEGNHFPPQGSEVNPSPPPGYIRELRSMGGRYVSYWNAFLFWYSIKRILQHFLPPPSLAGCNYTGNSEQMLKCGFSHTGTGWLGTSILLERKDDQRGRRRREPGPYPGGRLDTERISVGLHSQQRGHLLRYTHRMHVMSLPLCYLTHANARNRVFP